MAYLLDPAHRICSCFHTPCDEQGHSHCMEFLAGFGVPMLVLGGGGYTMRNVARCWCFETGRLLGLDLPDKCASSAHSWLSNDAARLMHILAPVVSEPAS